MKWLAYTGVKTLVYGGYKLAEVAVSLSTSIRRQSTRRLSDLYNNTTR